MFFYGSIMSTFLAEFFSSAALKHEHYNYEIAYFSS